MKMVMVKRCHKNKQELRFTMLSSLLVILRKSDKFSCINLHLLKRRLTTFEYYCPTLSDMMAR